MVVFTRVLLLLAMAALFGRAAGTVFADQLLTFAGETMGTSYTIRVAHLPAGLDTDQLHSEIDRRLEQLNDQMSTWRPESELSRFNRYDGKDWFPVSRETAEVVTAAIRIGRKTGGAFDVTVGTLVNLWQFGPEEQVQLPNDDELAVALEAIGYQQLQARLDPPALRKSRSDIYVDLSGIAKGYGVDQIAELLNGHGITDYLVEIGGEIRTRGWRPDGGGWRVGIEVPTEGRRTLQRTLQLSGQALATSGDYRNFREVDGRRWSHTIDPRTGRPIGHALASVTVVTEQCMEADALATALMVLGPGRAYDWAVEHDLAALLILRDAGRFVERPSPRFDELFPREAANLGGLPMETFFFALIIFAVAVVAMAVGVLFGRRRLRGTCGGLANLRDSAGRPMCDACHDPSPDCSGVEEGRRRRDEGRGMRGEG